MEPFLAEWLTDFLTNKKIPKAIRYLVLGLVIGLLTALFVYLAVISETVIGVIACGAVGLLMVAAGIYLGIRKVHAN